MLRSAQNSRTLSTGFLLVLGLAIGLWMGFNPQTHKQVTQSWSETRTFFAHIGTNISTSTHKWVSQFKAGEKTTPTSKTKPQPPAAAGQWISNALANLGKFLQKTWLGITASLHLK